MTTTGLLAVLMAVSVAFVLLGERRGWRWLVLSAKPLASGCFVVVALLRYAPGDRYGTSVLVALALCLVGDVLLIFKKAFRVGLVSFLFGQLAYAMAFHALVPVSSWPLLPAVPLLAIGVLTARWLSPHLGEMRVPVFAYVAVISVMVWGAAAAVLGGRATPQVVVGALLFYASDLAVARDRFVERAFVNRAIGLPLYYIGQLLLASSVGSQALG